MPAADCFEVGHEKTMHLKTLFITLAAGTLAAAANAQYAVNTFGPGQTFNQFSGEPIQGSGAIPGQSYESMGEQFRSGASGEVTDISVAFHNVFGTNSGVISLETDDAGSLGTVMESWNVSSLPSFNSAGVVDVYNGSPSVSLISGQNYWLVLSPGSGDTYDAWMDATSLDKENLVFSTDGGSTWTPYSLHGGAFSVQVATVPGPAPIAVLGLSALGFAIRRRKR
jgi:hypothetical protein